MTTQVHIFIIGILNILDFFFTELALRNGAKEINPVVLMLMATDYYPDIKLGLISLSLFGVWLVSQKVKFSAVTRAVISVTSYSYIMVTSWHLVIAWHLYDVSQFATKGVERYALVISYLR